MTKPEPAVIELHRQVARLMDKGYLLRVEPAIPADPFSDLLAHDRTRIQRGDPATDRRLKDALASR